MFTHSYGKATNEKYKSTGSRHLYRHVDKDAVWKNEGNHANLRQDENVRSIISNDPHISDARQLQKRQNTTNEKFADEASSSTNSFHFNDTNENQRQNGTSPHSGALLNKLAAHQSSGKSLPSSEKNKYETFFQSDLSSIKIHEGSETSTLLRSVGAQGMSYGEHVFIDQKRFEGDISRPQLLAHELTHTLQHKSQNTSSAGASSGLPAAKITVTEEMWQKRFEIEIRKYKLALEGADIKVRQWSLKQAIDKTNTHLGTAKGLFSPKQKYLDKAAGTKPKETAAEETGVKGKIGENYIDNFDAWEYDVNHKIVKEGGGEWMGASPWLILHFGGSQIEIDMRQINEGTLSGDKIKYAFENRYLQNGVEIPAIISPSTAMNVVTAMQLARQRRDEEFGFTNKIALLGVASFFMSWPSFNNMPMTSGTGSGVKGAGAWTQRAAKLKQIQETRKSIQPLRELANKYLKQAQKNGGEVLVDIGGTGRHKGAININPGRSSMPKDKNTVPNLLETEGRNIGNLFPESSINRIISENVEPGRINWYATAEGVKKVLKPGGTVSVIQLGGAEAPKIAEAFRLHGFLVEIRFGKQVIASLPK